MNVKLANRAGHCINKVLRLIAACNMMLCVAGDAD